MLLPTAVGNNPSLLHPASVASCLPLLVDALVPPSLFSCGLPHSVSVYSNPLLSSFKKYQSLDLGLTLNPERLHPETLNYLYLLWLCFQTKSPAEALLGTGLREGHCCSHHTVWQERKMYLLFSDNRGHSDLWGGLLNSHCMPYALKKDSKIHNKHQSGGVEPWRRSEPILT